MTALAIDAEHEPLRDVVWGLLRQHSGSEQVHRIVDAGEAVAPRLDAAFAELGLFGIDVDEQHGGGGGTTAHLRHVAEGCGWAAATTRLLGTSAGAVGALEACRSEDVKRRWLPPLADGSTGATTALPGGSPDGWRGGIAATRDGDLLRLSGTAAHVVDLLTADAVVVLAELTGEPVLAVVSTDSSTVLREREEPLDLTRSLGRLVLDGTPVTPEGVIARGTEDVTACVENVAQRTALLVAADSLGVASRVVELTTEYAKQREQFGWPIGAFQAVKHQAADMLVRIEMSRALLDEAALAYDEGRNDAPRLISMAKDYCCSSAAWVAGRGIQLHGGIGYTWEHDMHIYFKRAKLNEMLAGDRRWHRQRIMQQLRADRVKTHLARPVRIVDHPAGAQ